jgi:hypothetical protein
MDYTSEECVSRARSMPIFRWLVVLILWIVKKHLTTTHTLEVIDGMKRDNSDASSSWLHSSDTDLVRQWNPFCWRRCEINIMENGKEPSKVFPQYLAATAGKILKISLRSLKLNVLTEWELLHSSVCGISLHRHTWNKFCNFKQLFLIYNAVSFNQTHSCLYRPSMCSDKHSWLAFNTAVF